MIVTDSGIPFAFEYEDNCCILEFLSDGFFSFLHTMWNNSVSFSATGGPPVLSIYKGIASDPGALPDDRSFIAFTVSETVGNSSNSNLHSTCGSLLIGDGRLRTSSKCSAHLFKISSLSVRRLVLAALRSRVVPELWGPYTVLSASKNFFISFVSAKDCISSAFLLIQEYCMSLSLVWTVLHMFE